MLYFLTVIFSKTAEYRQRVCYKKKNFT